MKLTASKVPRIVVALLLAFAGAIAAAPKPAAEAPRARLLAAPKPVYPPEAVRQRVEGVGQFRIDMDFSTGKPTRVVVVKSTGSILLDNAAVAALRQWRAAPGAIRVINLPLVFRVSRGQPSVDFQ
jgi:TonB family protein